MMDSIGADLRAFVRGIATRIAGLGLIFATLATATFAFAPDDKVKEAEVQKCLCKGLEMNVMLKSGAEADCISDTHAIEVEWSYDWAEAIGQSLHYSEETGKRKNIPRLQSRRKQLRKP